MKRILPLPVLAAALAFGGCAFFSGGRQSRASASPGQSGAEKSISGFAHALRLKVWSEAEPYLSPEDSAYERELESRAEALWARGQIVDLHVEVLKLRKTADYYDARVKWSLSLLGSNGLESEDGKCDFYLRRTDSGDFLIFHIEGNAFL